MVEQRRKKSEAATPKRGRGRPKLPASERRTMGALQTRWTAAEVLAVETAAKRANVQPSALVRAGALQLAAQPVKAIREMIERSGT